MQQRRACFCKFLILQIFFSASAFSDTALYLDGSNSRSYKEYSYLDSYGTNDSQSLLPSAGLSGLYSLYQEPTHASHLEFRFRAFPNIKRTAYALGLVSQQYDCAGLKASSYAALDFTFYDGKNTQQLILGYMINRSVLTYDFSAYLPYRGGDQFMGPSGSPQVTAMPGFGMTASQKLAALTTSVSLKFFSKKSVADNIYIANVGAQYDFPMLTLAASYEYFTSMTDENTGFKISALLPIDSMLFGSKSAKVSLKQPYFLDNGVYVHRVQ